jgi:hypothetical protein
MHPEPGSDLGQFRQNLFLLRFDQQSALIAAKVEAKKVEPVIDMDDASLLFTEFQPTLGEPLLDHRDGSFETGLVGRRDDKVVSAAGCTRIGPRTSSGSRESAGDQIRQSVQRYVGYQWRTNGALGCALRRTEELSVLKVARLQTCLDLLTSRKVPESLIDVDVVDAVKRNGLTLPTSRAIRPQSRLSERGHVRTSTRFTRQTLERLVASGHTLEDARRLIGCVVSTEIYDVLTQHRSFDQVANVAALQRLPILPWEDGQAHTDRDLCHIGCAAAPTGRVAG